MPLGPRAKTVRYEEFDDLGFLALVPSDATTTLDSDRVRFDRRRNATILVTVGDQTQGAAFLPLSGSEERLWAPTSDRAVDRLREIGLRARSVDAAVVDGEPAWIVSADQEGPIAVVVHRERLFIVASIGSWAAVDPLTRRQDLDDFLARIEFVDPVTTVVAFPGYEITHPDTWSFDGPEIIPGPARPTDVRLYVSVAPLSPTGALGAEVRVAIGGSVAAVYVKGRSLDAVIEAFRSRPSAFKLLGSGRDVKIGGEPGFRWRLGAHGLIGPVEEIAVTVHGGRVYVMSQILPPGKSGVGPNYLDRLIAGFRFR